MARRHWRVPAAGIMLRVKAVFPLIAAVPEERQT
jgi:hypothetical protein